jgi:hypothetical protein
METRIEAPTVSSALPTRHPLVLAFLLVAAALVAACGPTAGPLGTPASPALTPAPSGEPTPSDVAPGTPTPAPTEAPTETPSGEPADSPTPTPTPSGSASGTTIVRAYFVLGSFTDNDGLVPVLREIPATKAVARAAMLQLLGGPQGVELEGSPAMYSGIPEGTKLLDLTVANGVATVQLSKEFREAAQNVQATTARGQIVYTLTQFSTVKQVRIGVDGGEPEPAAGRADYQNVVLPAIFVDRPAWGAAAGNPVAVSGIANVFEATFQVQVLDGKGNVVGEKTVMATCGTGCWGSFKANVPYTIGKAQYGTLRVFDYSARDGQPENVTEYRVWLTPAG